MAELSERHEVRVRGKDNTIVFEADSSDGRLVIRQEWHGKGRKESCAITLADPGELEAFFKGLRRIMASIGTIEERAGPSKAPRLSSGTAPATPTDIDEREALVAKARQKNPQAFAPWTKDEEQEIAKRYRAGESIEAIARTRKRSPRAIELRLQRLGLIAGEGGS